jgi:hypothetical protein
LTSYEKRDLLVHSDSAGRSAARYFPWALWMRIAVRVAGLLLDASVDGETLIVIAGYGWFQHETRRASDKLMLGLNVEAYHSVYLRRARRLTAEAFRRSSNLPQIGLFMHIKEWH